MPEVKPMTYTPKEVATILGVDPMTVYRHCKSGHIPSIKLGDKVLIPRAHIDALVADPPIKIMVQNILEGKPDGDGEGSTVSAG